MDPARPVRVGDREREAVVDLLQRHAAEGRLRPEELEDRIEAAYQARTDADLVPLTDDLPAAQTEPAGRVSRPPAHWRSLTVRWAIVNAAAIAIWLAAGDGEADFWPKWVLVLSTIVLVIRIARHADRADDPPPARIGPARRR